MHRAGLTHIVGAGSLGKMVISTLLDNGSSPSELAFVDDRVPSGTHVLGIPVIGPTSLLLRDGVTGDVVIAIADNYVRERVWGLLSELPMRSVIHRSAVVSRFAEVGRGSIILPNTSIDPDAVVGCGVVINKNASVGHNAMLADFAQASPGALLGGPIGERAFLGLGATVLPNVAVGADTIVGAGAVVTRDIPARSVAVGVPAQVVGTNRKSDPRQ
jgi:sugar O-acyltransferase (sialic acid O-acetyltransferase NeuD family)